MFSLIAVTISIVLGLGIALAALYYGGSAFTTSSAKTTALALINAGEQVKAVLQTAIIESASSNSVSTATQAFSEMGRPPFPPGIPGFTETSLPGPINWSMTANPTPGESVLRLQIRQDILIDENEICT
ncbi:hypothetical protein [Thalassospira xiamenensis]|uniref:Uncharacterized protein n=1 Tax=Thalassospira xiamenensis TaxID=220697 RepID=A0A285TRF4_9PROT|nr:hypothetical protein [Thalassospira xiamenensis]SOC26181.1 hypothetical protein SAMN05428964_10574 [Thalassospira xiamenensis]